MSREKDRPGPQRVGSILEGVLDQLGLARRMNERDLLADWPKIVGEAAALHVRAVDLRDGELILEADHAAWRQELTLLAPTIIGKFNALHGADTVRSLRFARGPERRHWDDTTG